MESHFVWKVIKKGKPFRNESHSERKQAKRKALPSGKNRVLQATPYEDLDTRRVVLKTFRRRTNKNGTPVCL